MTETLPDYSGIAAMLSASATSPGTFSALDDPALVDAVEAITSLKHAVERAQALAAAEIVRRSKVAFGIRGLAQRTGHASAGELLQTITHATKRETTALVGVGQMVAETEAAAELDAARRIDPELAALVPEAATPWFAALGAAVTSGALTVAVADAIRSGLGEPGGDGDDAALSAALETVIGECRELHADAARRYARQVRDRIDAASVAERADRQRERQFWRVWVKPDGMVRGEFELDAESGMLVKAVFDQLTHPRRVSAPVRRSFGDPVHGDSGFAEARAARERDAADGLVQLLRAGASVDPSRVLDAKKPSVRLVVNATSLSSGKGSGAIEGHPDRIPLGNIHAGLCEGYLPILFDETGACLDLGRDERLYTRTQKAVLAVRDGGCLDPDCTRPPSWTEAHHIEHWQRDDGRTDIADGILLCRRDHLRYHNQGWEVRRRDSTYWLIPPVDVDPEQTPRLMRSKTPADIVNPVEPQRLPTISNWASGAHEAGASGTPGTSGTPVKSGARQAQAERALAAPG
ncbi:HNH endonuclease [Agromyces laixinhei]|uniref:HNH endonuclease n=1 Tax=Agromyces laixinhei TaxID=2585717 RepID=UPI0012EE1482|nr:HNH endonuclease [Agromyces laixinhei]